VRVGSLTLRIGRSELTIDTDSTEVLEQWRDRYRPWMVDDRRDVPAAFSLLTHPPHRSNARPVPVLRSGSTVVARGRSRDAVDAALDARLGSLAAPAQRLMRCRWFVRNDRAVAVLVAQPRVVDDPSLAASGIIEAHTWGAALGDGLTCSFAAGLTGLSEARTASIVGAVLAADGRADGAVMWAATANSGAWLDVLAALDDHGRVRLSNGNPGPTRAAIAALIGSA
jgi:hypothetical protein